MAQCGDMHELATLNIAKAAGYSDEDAVLVAWADGETDHSLQVKWWNCPFSNLGIFYHFIPSAPDNLICQPDSELSRRIIDGAKSNPPWSIERKCAVGIALHGLQDTYFHQNWAGKFSRHNVLPAWWNKKFTPSLPFPYGHSPKGLEPDIATATWYDPRSNETIINRERVFDAIAATCRVLGNPDAKDVFRIFADVDDYEKRKEALRKLAGMTNLSFSSIRAEMLAKYKKLFTEAARVQAEIVKDYLKCGDGR